MKTKIRLRETGKNLGLTFKEDVCNFYKLQDGIIFEMELRDDCIILYPTSEIKERSARGRKKKEEWFLPRATKVVRGMLLTLYYLTFLITLLFTLLHTLGIYKNIALSQQIIGEIKILWYDLYTET